MRPAARRTCASPNSSGCSRPGDLLVVNETRVIPARAFGRKASGGRGRDAARARAGRRSGARAAAGESRAGTGGCARSSTTAPRPRSIERRDPFFVLRFSRARPRRPRALRPRAAATLHPTRRRARRTASATRRCLRGSPGSVAAPTAGLHFDAGPARAAAGLGVGRGRESRCTWGRARSRRCATQQVAVRAPARRAGHGRRMRMPSRPSPRARRGWPARRRGRHDRRACARDGGPRRASWPPFDGETDLFIRPGYMSSGSWMRWSPTFTCPGPRC